MKAPRVLTFLAAAALIIGAIAWRVVGRDTKSTPSTGGKATAQAGDVDVHFVFSPEKKDLLTPLIDAFNRDGHTVGGKRIVVTPEVVSSGDSTSKITKGTLKPVVWSPASSLWGRLLNFQRNASWVPPNSPSLVRTPLVIAMWQPLAKALGWPRKALGWSDVLREAQSPRGWAAYGHPEWGAFKLGHTNPDFSTSGLSAVVAEYASATGKVEGLTLADVKSPVVRTKVRAIERSIVHYGDTTLFFSDRLAEFGLSYASAVAMEEVTLLDFNLKKAKGGQRLVAIYPKEGTFYSDNPLIVLDAPWVSADQRDGAKQLLAFLAERVTPEIAASAYFRPADTTKVLGAPFTAANLVDPKQPVRLLGLPEPRVLDALGRAWRADRKPATIQLVLDISGSMNVDGKLEGAKSGAIRFLSLLQPQDRVGLTVFSDEVTTIAAPQPLAQARGVLTARIKDLAAGGGTAVYQATNSAVETLAKDANPSRLSAVVVLTDGADNKSTIDVAALERSLRNQAESERTAVRVFAIAYGADASKPVLDRIAAAARGRAYSGDPATIEKVYTQISSFF